MKPYDVVGYTADADVYCPLCATTIYGEGILGENGIKDHEGNLVAPVFAEAEFDYPASCGKCHEFINTNLTSVGIMCAYDMIEESLEKESVTDFLMEVSDSLLWMNLSNSPAVHRIRMSMVLEYIDMASKQRAL
jgi:hypothetical protein